MPGLRTWACVATGPDSPVLCMQDRTKIKFCTDGMLIRDMLEDPLLSSYRYLTVPCLDAVCASTVWCQQLLPQTPPSLQGDPLKPSKLNCCSVVMVDEAHERSLATDVLLGLLKKVQRRRADLRIVISSATLEAEKLAAFFDTSTVKGRAAPPGAGQLSRTPGILSVQGRTHGVQVGGHLLGWGGGVMR